MNNLQFVAQQFNTNSPIVEISAFGDGLINDTFLVLSADKSKYILQRLNTTVFSQPKLVLNNIISFSDYINSSPKLKSDFFLPKLLNTHNQDYFFIDESQQYWRMMEFIENSISFNTISGNNKQTSHIAKQAGCGLGLFHSYGFKVEPSKLKYSLPGFHIAPLYLNDYLKSLKFNKNTSSVEDKFCKNFIHDRRDIFNTLEHAKKNNLLQESIIHGDPKLNNFLFHKKTHNILSIIDLDTLQPGLIHYDIGDCLRSICNLSGESSDNKENIKFNIEIANDFLSGYLGQVRPYISLTDLSYFYEAIRLLPLELGTRFYTDYLNGDLYFKTTQPKQNLQRACCQFYLVENIELQQENIKAMINKYT